MLPNSHSNKVDVFVHCFNEIAAFQIKTDEKDRPLEDVRILDTVVFVDPFAEAEKQVEELRRAESENLEQKNKEAQKKEGGSEVSFIQVQSSTIGSKV